MCCKPFAEVQLLKGGAGLGIFIGDQHSYRLLARLDQDFDRVVTFIRHVRQKRGGELLCLYMSPQSISESDCSVQTPRIPKTLNLPFEIGQGRAYVSNVTPQLSSASSHQNFILNKKSFSAADNFNFLGEFDDTTSFFQVANASSYGNFTGTIITQNITFDPSSSTIKYHLRPRLIRSLK